MNWTKFIVLTQIMLCNLCITQNLEKKFYPKSNSGQHYRFDQNYIVKIRLSTIIRMICLIRMEFINSSQISVICLIRMYRYLKWQISENGRYLMTDTDGGMTDSNTSLEVSSTKENNKRSKYWRLIGKKNQILTFFYFL